MQNDELVELFRAHGGSLERRVTALVRAPRGVIEDACQFAWGQLVGHRDRVDGETVMAWLSTTATREAVRQVRLRDRELSLESELEQRGDRLFDSALGRPHELAQIREQVRLVGRLPARQGRIVWLRALGFSHAEVADHEDCTGRTVERQLCRARRALTALAGEGA